VKRCGPADKCHCSDRTAASIIRVEAHDGQEKIGFNAEWATSPCAPDGNWDAG
jgi:hypothetical protein